MARPVIIYLDEDLHSLLMRTAETSGRTTSEIVNEAVRRDLAKDAEDLATSSTLRPTSLGAGHSGRGDLSERSEELLAAMKAFPRHRP